MAITFSLIAVFIPLFLMSWLYRAAVPRICGDSERRPPSVVGNLTHAYSDDVRPTC